MKKLLTYYGRGRFVVPGFCELAAGQSATLPGEVADAVAAANPNEPISVDALPSRSRKTAPEAPAGGEGHTSDPPHEEE